MPISSHDVRNVRTAAHQLDTAAVIFAVVIGTASLIAAYGLRHAGFFVWAPVAAVGLATASLVHSWSSVVAASARLAAKQEDRAGVRG